jgi:hypothetical protein
MAINPNEYTISYDKLLKSTSARQRFDMAQADNTFYSQLIQALTPSQLANLFPRYYRERLPDIGGFQLATSQIASGKFGQGLPSAPITSEAPSSYVSPKGTKTKKQIGKDSDLTGEVNKEKLRKSLPANVRKAFDEVVRNKKTQSFSSTDDPFSGLSDAELKSIGIKRSQQAVHPQSTRNIYVKDTMSVEAAKKKVLSEFKSESEVTGFKFKNPITTFRDNKLTGKYYATYGAGMGNKEDNAKIQTELANYIAKKGKEAGYTDAAIKGMVANAMAESHLGLLPYGDHGDSGGVFHLNVRGAGAEAGVDVRKYHVNKSNVKDVDEYIASMKDSIDESFDLFQNNKNYAGLNEILKTSNNFEETTTAFVRDFEKPKIVNAADRIVLAKKMGIDTATLDEKVSAEDMPKFVQVVKSMDDETLKKLGGIIETGPGGMGAGVNIVDFAEKLQTPEEFNEAEANLAEIMHKKGLTESGATAEKLTAAPAGSFIRGYDPSEDYSLPGKGNATSKYAEENFMPAMNFIGGLGLGKAIGENPYVRQGVFNPEGTETITGHSPKGHHRGAHAALAADISSGEGVRPKWVKQVGSQAASLEINQALGDLMFNEKMVSLLKPTELINQGRRLASSSGWRLSPKGHGHPNHVHFAPSRNVTAETYDQVRQILFTNPEYFGDEGKRFADTMVKHGLWTETKNGYELSRDKYAEFYEQQKEEKVKAEVQPETSAEEQTKEQYDNDYTTKSAKSLQNRLEYLQKSADQNEDTAFEIKDIQNELKYRENDRKYAAKSVEELTAEIQNIKDDSAEALAKKSEIETAIGRRENGAAQDAVMADGSKETSEKQSQSTSEPLITTTGEDANSSVKLAEGGTIKAKDNLKVVRKDGSPTGIEVASDETAVIIPPKERRQAQDVVSLDGTDQRASDVAMDEDVLSSKSTETPKNVASMSTGGYSPSNQSTTPSSLGAIDYAPSALRAYARDKYFDNHGYHSAPRTIYAQK